MTDHPILFSGPMVQAVLREIEAPGTGKTQTRRILKLPKGFPCWDLAETDPERFSGLAINDAGRWGHSFGDDGAPLPITEMPQYRIGDLLWCRETFWQASRYPATLPGGEPEPLSWCWGNLFHYAADGSPPNCHNRHYGPEGLKGGAFAAPDPYAVWLKRPSIFMPRRASRLTLEVTGVKVERLHNISEADAASEGVESDTDGWIDYQMPATQRCTSARGAFKTLWNSINGPNAWALNPWVCAVTFRPHLCNIDSFIEGQSA